MDTTSSRVAIITDSTSDIPVALAAERGVTVVPLTLSIDGTTYTDGDLTQAEFFALMNASPALPTTSQPAVGTFVEYYERALETASEVVSIHISNALSGTIESAHAAAESFGGRVHVFDTLNLSMGLGLQVLEAAKVAATGAGAEEILRSAEKARDRVRMIVGLDKLDNLAKGGRIGAVSAFLGGLLNLKVTFTVNREGKFEPVARTRGTHAALDHTIAWCKEQMAGRTAGTFCVMHAFEEDRAQWLREQLEAAFEVTEMYVVETGIVISTHTGTGWGVALLPAE